MYDGRWTMDDFEKIIFLMRDFFEDEEERDAFLDWIWLRAFNLLKWHVNWTQIDKLARKLLEKGKLTGEEAEDAMLDFRFEERPKDPPGLNPELLITK